MIISKNIQLKLVLRLTLIVLCRLFLWTFAPFSALVCYWILDFAVFNLISRDVTCTCTRLTRVVCIRMCIWSVCIGMYKLNSTWLWRFSWNVDLGTIIVVVWVRIVMQHTEVRIFHAAQISNNFGGLSSDWNTTTDKFVRFHAWQIICPALRQDDGVFEVW